MIGINKQTNITMKNKIFLFCLLAALAVSCVKEQQEVIQTITDDPVFYAAIEEPGNPVTRVFADSQLRVLWNADDRVSIFNKSTYNRQYRFDGQDGDNSGAFKVVPNDDFVTSNPLDYVYSVYPYNENTKISNDGEITVYLPAEQPYRGGSFGLGSNTMVSVTDNNELHFKNLCGYFVIKLYGDNVSVSSISLRGNNDELLAGKAAVTAPADAFPSLSINSSEAARELTLTFNSPVTLGSTAETATTFWFVVPPVTFEKGITLTVNDGLGGSFVKSTSGSLDIKRNVLKTSTELEVEIDPAQPKNVIYYTSSDGEIVKPYNFDAFGASILSNEYVNGHGVISFDNDVTSIGDEAFADCRSLTDIILPNGVISIGHFAFSNCSSLTDITIPESVTSIGYAAFEYCSSLLRFSGKFASQDGHFLIDSGQLVAVACAAIEGNMTLPADVTVIGSYAFSGCHSLVGITIPTGVVTIGRCAFFDCKHLTDLTLLTGLASIENYAFINCNSLTDITIPESVISIGFGAFKGCSSLLCFSGKYASQDGLFLVDSGQIIAVAFAAMKGKITIPDGVTSIGNSVFSNCHSLTNIILPNGVTDIGQAAFYGCSSLVDIMIPNTITSIGDSAFQGCSSLTGIIIPSGVTSIGNYAFCGCHSLTDVTIFTGVTSIGNYAFYGCQSLTGITIPDGMTRIGDSAFRECSSLTGITIPGSVLSIGDYAFDLCVNLSAITIHDGLTSIGYKAFCLCSNLKGIILPKSVTSIGGWAFSGCDSLTSIKVLAIIPPLGAEGMFNIGNSALIIYVPSESLELYKTAKYWSNWDPIIKAIPT